MSYLNIVAHSCLFGYTGKYCKKPDLSHTMGLVTNGFAYVRDNSAIFPQAAGFWEQVLGFMQNETMVL